MSQVEDRDDLRRIMLKKRLHKWGSFFDKLQKEHSNTTNEDLSDELCEVTNENNENTLSDPKFLAVDEEHEKIRESLCSQIGISQDELQMSSSDCDDDTDNQRSCSSKRKIVEDPAVSSEAASSGHSSLIWSNRINGCTEGRQNKSRQSKHKRIEMKQQQDIQLCHKNKAVKKTNKMKLTSKKDSLSRSQSPLKSSSPLQRHSGEDPPSSKNNVSKTRENIKGKERFDSPCKNTASHENKLHMSSSPSRSFPLTSTPIDKCSKKHLFLSEIDLAEDQTSNAPSIADLCEQYELWKLYKRRKSGKFGSVYIVSSIYDEPTEANRVVPDLPAVVKKPVFPPRRFSLQKPVHW